MDTEETEQLQDDSESTDENQNTDGGSEGEASSGNETDGGEQAVEGANEGEKPSRPSRKERQQHRFKEHTEIVNQRQRITDLENQISQLTAASQRAAEATQRMADSFSESRKPQPESLEQRVKKQLRAAAKSAKDDDEYEAEAARILAEAARESAAEVVQAEMGKFRKEMPRNNSVPANEAAYYAIAPWLGDRKMYGAVYQEVERLKSVKGLDLRNEKVFDATVKQAIAKVGAEWGKPVNLPTLKRNPSGAVAGTGSSRGGNDEGSFAGLPEHLKRRADENPQFAKIKNPEQRYRAYEKYMKDITEGRG